MGHGIIKCSCGNLIAQCRCPDHLNVEMHAHPACGREPGSDRAPLVAPFATPTTDEEKQQHRLAMAHARDRRAEAENRAELHRESAKSWRLQVQRHAGEHDAIVYEQMAYYQDALADVCDEHAKRFGEIERKHRDFAGLTPKGEVL